MAWSKFYTYMTILSCTMFLDLQLQDEDEQQETLVQTMRALLPTESSVPPSPIAHQAPYAPSTPAVRLWDAHDDKMGREEMALGVIYLIAAFLSYIVSTQDYFACVRQLEAEHTYLDECEGHSHPLVTILSCVIGLMIMATVLLMIAQREDA